jgi:hypothetical protein
VSGGSRGAFAEFVGQLVIGYSGARVEVPVVGLDLRDSVLTGPAIEAPAIGDVHTRNVHTSCLVLIASEWVRKGV